MPQEFQTCAQKCVSVTTSGLSYCHVANVAHLWCISEAGMEGIILYAVHLSFQNT